MKKIIVMMLFVSGIVFASENQTPVKAIRAVTMDKSISSVENIGKAVEIKSSSNLNVVMDVLMEEANNKSVTSHWKAELLLGLIFMLLGLTFVGRTKRKRVVLYNK